MFQHYSPRAARASDNAKPSAAKPATSQATSDNPARRSYPPAARSNPSTRNNSRKESTHRKQGLLQLSAEAPRLASASSLVPSAAHPIPHGAGQAAGPIPEPASFCPLRSIPQRAHAAWFWSPLHSQSLFPRRQLIFEWFSAGGAGALIPLDDVSRAQGVVDIIVQPHG